MLEELAPGRTLVQIVGGTHDGRHVVVMGAGRPSGTHDLSWYLDGEDPPPLPFAPEPAELTRPRRSNDPRRSNARTSGATPSRAQARANALLESLLSAEQREDWRNNHRFWVPTPRGQVQLGWLYHLEFRPAGRGRRLVLCVVPVEPARHCARMPLPDIWVNLLLVLQSDPDRFFAVANWREAGGGDWHPPPVPRAAPTLFGSGQVAAAALEG